ncbi:MAG: hypothetical protein KDD53_12480, partial [Bdellovibrionales bacterium]|nr:hypothetical protein [Bdellovibrionales bacterium]
MKPPKLLSTNCTDCRLRQSGFSVVLLAGLLSLLLLLAAFGVNMVRYYELKSRTRTLVKEITTYGGTALPDPVNAAESALKLLKATSQNLLGGGDTPFSNPNTKVNIKIFFDSKAKDRATIY